MQQLGTTIERPPWNGQKYILRGWVGVEHVLLPEAMVNPRPKSALYFVNRIENMAFCLSYCIGQLLSVSFLGKRMDLGGSVGDACAYELICKHNAWFDENISKRDID